MEGWHNGLRHTFQHVPHPELGMFLKKILDQLKVATVRRRGLSSGTIEPVRPSATDVKRNEEIAEAKATLNRQMNSFGVIDDHLIFFLDYVQYRLGNDY